jgi:hypothetical protein
MTVAAGSLQNQELMPKSKDLSLQRYLSSKALPNERKRRENDRAHGPGKLQQSPLKFNGFNKNEVFGRDKCVVHEKRHLSGFRGDLNGSMQHLLDVFF